MNEISQQDSLPTLEPKPNKSKDNEIQGNRITPSQIEQLYDLYEKRMNSETEYDFLFEISKQKDLVRKEEVLRNAKASIYGTQIHNLTYFTQIFERAKRLNRDPMISDFQNTFLYRDDDYYLAIDKILTSTDMRGSNPAQAFWNEWRMNEQDFIPKKKGYPIIKPEEIREIWENNPIPLNDIKEFNSNISKIEENKLDPRETLLINEVVTITNLYFPNSNMQVPTVIDEVYIPYDFPAHPIHIVDYKTGKQFKRPEFKEKVQIFLMMNAVYTNILDMANRIQFYPSQWDLAYNLYNFPSFIGKSSKKNFISSAYFEKILESSDLFKKYLTFSYINPITQQKMDFSTKDIGIDTTENMSNMLFYLENLNTFYTKYKDLIKRNLKIDKNLYFLPTFPNKNSGSNGGQRIIQPNLI